MTKNINKRLTIMQAAEKLFTSRRFHEITMDDIAGAAGVAKGTLYGYFQDKEELFFQTATSGFEELCGLVNGVSPEDGEFADQLLSACRQISAFFEQRHQLLRLMQAEDGRMFYCKGGLRDRWMRKRRELVAAVASILQRGVAQGKLRQDLPAEVLADFLLGMLRTRLHWLGDAPPAVREHEVIVDLFCQGAGMAAARPPAAARRKAAASITNS